MKDAASGPQLESGDSTNGSVDAAPAPAAAPVAIPAAVWRYGRHVLQIVIPLAVIWAVWHEVRKIHFSAVRADIAEARIGPLAAAAGLSLAAVAVMGFYDALAFPSNERLRFGRRWTLGTLIFGWTNFISLGPLGGPALRIFAYRKYGLNSAQITRGFVGHYVGLGSGLTAWLAALWTPLPGSEPHLIARALAALVMAPLLSMAAGRIAVSIVRRHHWGSLLKGIPLARLGIVSYFDWGLTIAAFAVVGGAVADQPAFVSDGRALLLGHIAGIASMIPGGLGSADAVWLAMLSAGGTLHHVAAAQILLFRVVYYLVPWLGSFAALYFLFAGRSPRLVRWQRRILAAAVTLNAGLLLASAATPALRPRLTHLARLVPVGAIEASHAMAVVSAAMMLYMVRGLLRGYRSAWMFIAFLLIASALAHVLKGGDFEEATASVILLAMMLGVRSAFDRDGRVPIGWELTISAAVGSIAFFLVVGFAAFERIPYHNDLWTTFAAKAEASRFLRASLLLGVVAVGFFVRQAVKPVKLTVIATAEEIGRAIELIRARADRAAALAVGCGDKGVWFWPGGGLAVYQRRQDSMIILADPVLEDPARSGDLVAGLHEFAEQQDWDIVFYQVSGEWMVHLHDFGYHFFKLGQEAVIPLEGYSLAGGRNAGFRRTIRRLEADGVTFEVLDPPYDSETIEQVRRVSDTWLAEKHAREMQFSIGYFSQAYIQRFPLAVARDAEGRIAAFVNLLSTRPGGEITIDFMRHVSGFADNIMDYVILRACEWSRDAGYAAFSLGMAPLFDVGQRPTAAVGERLASFAYRHAERFYNYRGLWTYKNKFHPTWQPRYLAYQDPWGGPGAALLSVSLVKAWGRADRRRIRESRNEPIAAASNGSPVGVRG